jgi:hypothetical protein
MPRSKIKIPRSFYLRIASAVPCDDRTVRRYFDGRPLTGVAEGAIRRALAQLGIADPRPPQTLTGRA